MKTTTRQWAVLGAAAAAVLMAVPLTASALNAGTITFSGAIVAPQLEVSAAPVATGAQAETLGAQQSHQGAAVTLTFNAPPGATAGADVALQVDGGATSRDAVAARFVDSGGHIVAASRDGHYKVGRDGGVMSLSEKNAVADTRVTVVMSYD